MVQSPRGTPVDHKCKLKRCVRLDHLRVLPNLENARRTSGRDWPLGFCVQGHLDAEHWRPSGAGRVRGYCSACNAEAQRKYRAKSAAPL